MFSKSKRFSYSSIPRPISGKSASEDDKDIRKSGLELREDTFVRQAAKNRTFLIRKNKASIGSQEPAINKSNQTFKKIANSFSRTFSRKRTAETKQIDKYENNFSTNKEDFDEGVTWADFDTDLTEKTVSNDSLQNILLDDDETLTNDEEKDVLEKIIIDIESSVASEIVESVNEDIQRTIKNANESLQELIHQTFIKMQDESQKKVYKFLEETTTYNEQSLAKLQNNCRNTMDKLNITIHDKLQNINGIHARQYIELRNKTAILEEQLEATKSYADYLEICYWKLLVAREKEVADQSYLIDHLKKEIKSLETSLHLQNISKKQTKSRK